MDSREIVNKVIEQAKDMNFCKDKQYEDSFLVGYLTSSLEYALRIMSEHTREIFVKLQLRTEPMDKRHQISSETPRNNPELLNQIRKDGDATL